MKMADPAIDTPPEIPINEMSPEQATQRLGEMAEAWRKIDPDAALKMSPDAATALLAKLAKPGADAPPPIDAVDAAMGGYDAPLGTFTTTTGGELSPAKLKSGIEALREVFPDDTAVGFIARDSKVTASDRAWGADLLRRCTSDVEFVRSVLSGNAQDRHILTAAIYMARVAGLKE